MSSFGQLTACCALSAALVLASFSQTTASERLIALKRQKDLSISLTNDVGRFLGGKNKFCVSFAYTANAEPVLIKKVMIEFAEQVGKIEERPINAAISEQGPGRYCGEVDLGRQSYHPALYHVTTHYVDASNRKRNWHVLVNIK